MTKLTDTERTLFVQRIEYWRALGKDYADAVALAEEDVINAEWATPTECPISQYA